jgi:hypothetical protein
VSLVETVGCKCPELTLGVFRTLVATVLSEHRRHEQGELRRDLEGVEPGVALMVVARKVGRDGVQFLRWRATHLHQPEPARAELENREQQVPVRGFHDNRALERLLVGVPKLEPLGWRVPQLQRGDARAGFGSLELEPAAIGVEVRLTVECDF